MTEIRLWRLSFRVLQMQAQLFGDALAEDALALSVMQAPRQPQAEIEALYDAPPDKAMLNAQLAVIAASRGWPVPDLTITPLAPEDWLRKTAAALPPRQIGNLVIYGAHAADRLPACRPRLLIEAATAFGTGEHPSTQMCLLLLQNLLRHSQPRRALDLGCGSGILALALARLAHGRVLAIDNDAESVRMTRHNARANSLAAYVRAVQGSGYHPVAVRRGRPYDLVFANIFARPLMELAADLRAHLRPGGYAILAGLLTTQAPMVLAAHRLQRLRLVQSLRQGEWTALLLQRRQS